MDVTETLLARITSQDRVLNSYITVTAESARATAKGTAAAIDAGRSLGPLHGVPVALKDLFATKGVRTTFACAAFSDWVPDYDAAVVERLASAGAIIIGKNNLHEAAAGMSSLVSHHAPVRNPWNPDYIAGGSSGGSAAAIAAGLAYGAVGSDTAGSIRYPAACCGIVGLKPTYGRVSKYGALPLSLSLDHVGPMTRTVRDAALMLEVLAGFDQRDPASRGEPVTDCTVALDGTIRGLRIGIPRPHFFERCGQSTLSAVQLAIDTLRDLGARVEDCELPHASEAPGVGRIILLAEAAVYHADRPEQRPDLFSAGLRSILQTGRSFSAAQRLEAERRRDVIAQAFADVMNRFDAVVMPTAPLPACRADEDDASANVLRMQNTIPFNVSGQPAISIPCGFSEHGMPIGLQIVGRAFDEATILRIADAYERTAGWHAKHPS